MQPALLTEDKVVTGLHHGDAFSKLNEDEKNNPLISGFVDYEHFKFVTDDETIYLKEIILLRHAQSDIRKENGCITDMGRQQAFKAANFLSFFREKGFTGFCSPYLRCQQTSEIIKEICEIPFLVNECLAKGYCNTIEILELLPEKSIVVTHSDIIRNIIMLTHSINNTINSISNCSVTYIIRNRLIWLAREV
jgi:phosphohistidine phosphatase SixA